MGAPHSDAVPAPAEAVVPAYTDAQLASLGTPELWQLLVRHEDRVPRNLIDECARRGDEFLDLAAVALESERFWTEDQTRGEAWAPIHAAMILGLMPHDRAGVLLAAYMRRMAREDDLQDWLASCWPAFFRNKPREQLELLKALGGDGSVVWFMRLEAIDATLAMAEVHGDAVLGPTLEWAAGFAFDQQEDELLRDLLASTLLDFAPPQHRAQLESMADEGVWDGLDRDDIERIYAAGGEERHWARRSDPWSFYSPEEIEARQRRWADGDSPTEDEEDIFDGEADLDVVQTYVRSTPKIGRNDPCPCGSGKKYKKCCLAAGDSRS